MSELSFAIEGAEAVPHAAAPLLNLKLRVRNLDANLQIHNVLLQCQIQIEPVRRRYTPSEQEKMHDLFGEAFRWSRTLHPLLWANVSVVVPSFEQETLVNVPVACTFDFNIAATKYFYGLEDGVAPICALFSGTIFYTNPAGIMQVGKISWDRESNYGLPVRVWKDMMEMYYPNSAWLCLRRDVFDLLYQYKVSRGIPTWEQAFENMLASVEENDLRKTGV